MKLLTSNTKLEKTLDGTPWIIAGLSMSPHSLGFETVTPEQPARMRNLCPHATPGCRASCVLREAGRTVMSSVRDAAGRRKQLFLDNPELFREQLFGDLTALRRKATKMSGRAFCRLNVGTDVRWEDMLPELFTEFSDITFYDYSKDPARDNLPSNYVVTFSRSERNHDHVLRHLRSGRNVAVVFDVTWQPAQRKIGALPSKWNRFRVVDGDLHDARLPEFDGNGVVVGLRLKGTNRAKFDARRSGFAVPVASGLSDIVGSDFDAWKTNVRVFEEFETFNS